MDSSILPTIDDIRAAQERIKPYIHKTPVLSSSLLNEMFSASLYFKCENFQKVGAFKFRGATNAVTSLSKEELAKGVITHSSGNHAAALSLAAAMRGVKAYIVMPDNSPAVKKEAVAGYGAEITFCTSNLKSREETAQRIIDEKGATFIHAYNDFRVICGQGTAAVEMLEEKPDLDIIVAPVGGGGLMSGTATAARAMKPGIKILGAEPLGADDASKSFRSGEYIPYHTPDTIADGLLTTLSQRTFKIIRENVDEMLTVTEDSIIKAMELIWTRMKIIIEPSSAVVLAAIIENRDKFAGKKAGLILSGGNVDLRKLPFTVR